MELTLDTKENCFLCLQRIPEAEKNKLCLKNICRFLQINTSYVLLEGLKEGEKDIDAFNYNLLQTVKCNFSVTLCNPCYGVTGKLSSIIHDLEVAHLQVNYYSEVFQQILEKADVTSASINKTDTSQTADARMMEHLRKKTKQKCFARNKKALATTTRLPLVRLNKLTKETVTMMTNKCALASITPSSVLNAVGINISPSHNSTVKDKFSESFGILDPPISTGVLIEASSPGINEVGTENSMALRHDLVWEHEYKVMEEQHCSQKYENYGLSFTKSDPQVHPNAAGTSNEKTLSQPKLSEDPQLMSCSESLNSNRTLSYPVVEGVVMENWIPCPNKQVTTESQILEDPLTCDDWNDCVVVKTENCDESFSLQQIPEEEGHVAKKWKKHTKQNRNGRGSPVSVVAEGKTINSTSLTLKTSKGGVVCNHCGSIFPRGRGLQFHMIRIHPDQIFLSFKPVHRSESQFVDSCREIFQKETVGYHHAPKKTVPRQCAYCTKFHRHKQDFLMHLVNSHQKIIGEKIRVNSQKRVPETSKGRFACKNCNRRFPRALNEHLHMISHHPEQIFLRFKPAHLSQSQFADSCREIFERETVGYYNSNAMTRTAAPQQCAYCSELRRYKKDYLRHLVYSHTNIMGEKIKRFTNGKSQVGFRGALSEDAWNELKVETQNRNEKIDSEERTGESSQLNCAGNDNHSYPVVARVEEVNQKISSPKDPCKELLPGGDWNDVQVEGATIKTEGCSESSSKCMPILVDPLSMDEFNNCSVSSPVSLCDTDTKYDTNNGFVQ